MDELQNLLSFGNKIKELRKKKGLTQAQLAEALNLSVNFIGMVERAQRNTKVENVFKLARVLEVSPKDFFDF